MTGESVLPVTVVVPVRNEKATIGSLLDALAGQTRRPAGIVVVDAGSTDGTREILGAYQGRDPSLQVIAVPRAYPGEGRNLGTAVATTPWIAYTDGGVVPATDWLEHLWQAAEDGRTDAVYGFYRPALHTRVARWFAQAYLPGVRMVDGLPMRNHFIACSLVRRSAWKRVGGFLPFRAAEDRMFMRALDRDGISVEAPAAVVAWEGPQTWGQIWNRTATLAEHGARAGRMHDWHWPTVRLWLLGLLPFILLSAPWAAIVDVLALLVRALRRLARHRGEPALASRRPADLLAVALCLLVMDVALYRGWLRRLWVRRDPGAGAPPHGANAML